MQPLNMFCGKNAGILKESGGENELFLICHSSGLAGWKTEGGIWLVSAVLFCTFYCFSGMPSDVPR